MVMFNATASLRTKISDGFPDSSFKLANRHCVHTVISLSSLCNNLAAIRAVSKFFITDGSASTRWEYTKQRYALPRACLRLEACAAPYQ
jgi:hypothetical protein